MNKEEFLRLLEAQLELPQGSLKENQTLADLNSWDSMASVLFIALADEKLGVTVSGNEIAKAKTVKDLLSIVESRLAV
ncbi:MAG: acyl carrier protein [Acidobacteriia bacterium]|nr:acyl carrier protein [Terriglobia bacterium]MBV8905741.1 acyl carrier protein [Terriglobia bacterium]